MTLPAALMVAMLTAPSEGPVLAVVPSERIVLVCVHRPVERIAHVEVPADWDGDESDAFFDAIDSSRAPAGQVVYIRWAQGPGRLRRHRGHAVEASAAMLIRLRND